MTKRADRFHTAERAVAGKEGGAALTAAGLWFCEWGRQAGSSYTPPPPSPGIAAGSATCCAGPAATPGCGWSVAAGERMQLMWAGGRQGQCHPLPSIPHNLGWKQKHAAMATRKPGARRGGQHGCPKKREATRATIAYRQIKSGCAMRMYRPNSSTGP
jgi:hypothetical protein